MTQEDLIEQASTVTYLINEAKISGRKIGYVSGKITGLETNYVNDKFKKDTLKLWENNYWAFNPTEWIEVDCDWQMAMRLCLAVLPLCDKMFQQPDWHNSKGAIWEYDVAVRLGIKTVEL